MTAIGVMLIAATLLSLSRHDAWSARIFDLPRARVLVAAVAPLAAYVLLAGRAGPADIAFITGPALCALYQSYMIYPYAFLARKQVQPSRRARPASVSSLLFANVQMSDRNAARLKQTSRGPYEADERRSRTNAGGRPMQAWIKELLRHGDFLSLVLLTIVAGTVWGFVELADELMEGELEQFDAAILYFFRNPADPADPLGPRWLEELMRDATALGGVLVLTLLVLATAVSLWLENHRRAAVWLVIASTGAMGLSTLFKLLFARERPTLLAPELLPSTFSFPSGHAMLAASVYLTLGALLTRVVPNTRTRTFILASAIVLALLIGFSRIYLGMHYPSDVLAGWTLGLGWAALCWLVAWKLEKL